MEKYFSKTMILTSLGLLALSVIFKLVHMLWWKPKRLEKIFRQQGIKGTSYKFYAGDMPDMENSANEAMSKPIKLNQLIHSRVLPYSYKMVQQYGNVSLCWVGRTPRLIIADAELIKPILSNTSGHFVKPPRNNPYVNLLQKGVAFLEGEKWTKRRRQVTPAFHLEKLKAMEIGFLTSCRNLIERWQESLKAEGSCELDVAEEFHVLAGDVISRTAFGSSYEEGKMIFELQKEQVALVAQSLNRLYIPGFRLLPTKKNKRRYQINDQVKALLHDAVQRKLAAIKKGESKGHDLLSLLLLHRQDESGKSLTIEDVIEECKLFYFAGHETTANLLTWTMVLLSLHPNWQEKARQEVLEICGKSPPDFEAIHRLKIVSHILLEALRLYTPFPDLNRYTLHDTKIGNLFIPSGVLLYLPILFVHYDPKYWGEKAAEFNPERFSEGISKASMDQVAYYPFSWGQRTCVGQNFALIEAKMAVAMILQKFSFELSPSYTHAPNTRLSLQPQYGAPIILRQV